MAVTGRWQSRIIRHGYVEPDQLLAHPDNWRIHPKNQQDALSGVLDEIGWIQDVIVNERTGHVVDGHLRVSLAISKGERAVPVTFVDLSEAEEKLALATLDPLSAMAATDREQLGALLEEVAADDAAVSAMLERLAGKAGLSPEVPAEWQDVPEVEAGGLTVTVNFSTAAGKRAFEDLIGQSIPAGVSSIWFPRR